MNAPISTCPNCGKRLGSGALMGLCPACLLNTGFESLGSRAPNARTFVPPEPHLLERHFPRLQVIELIGQGGMGAVYKARQPQIDRIVALKILRANPTGDAEFAARFEREACALAKFHHPNIVTLYEFGQADGQYYLLMEYVDGVNLRQLLETRHISPKEALAIVPQICDALQYAHDRGVVHRDIKPENILIDRHGVLKIADFGVAKILGGPAAENAAKLVGTPRYMAPEQILHPLKVDNRADIYALGVVFYQMLTGELPAGKFEPPSRKAFFDVRLDEVVLRALEKKPEQRYQQASALKTQIETLVAEVTGEPAARAPRRFPIGPVLVGAAILVCLAAGLWAFRGISKGLEETDRLDRSDNLLAVSLDGPASGTRPAQVSMIDAKREGSESKDVLGNEAGSDGKAAAQNESKSITEEKNLLAAVEELKGLAAVGTIGIDALRSGSIVLRANTGLPVRHAVEVEGVYLIRTSKLAIQSGFLKWNPMVAHSVIVRHEAGSYPDSQQFASLGYGSAVSPMQKFVASTHRINAPAPIFNLSEKEIAMYRQGVADGGVIPPYVRSFWTSVLEERGGKLKPFDGKEGQLDLAEDFATLELKPQMNEGSHTRADDGQMLKSSGRYWEFIHSEVELHGERANSGAFVLGARSWKGGYKGKPLHTSDIHYYVTNGYYGSVKTQRITETMVDGKPAVLVWERYYLFTPKLQSLLESDRKEVAEKAVKDAKEYIEAFRWAFERYPVQAGTPSNR